ncbi:MAG: glutathione S-transferase family protein [Parvularculaceae bacterium]|jgi:glutathione S-transferase|nr:glutathione S-transferase family protein [Parvularculaceae bacterium]
MLTVIGSPVSPYVRKVLATLAVKGLDFEIDPVVAFYTDDRFTRLNPLRRIPLLIDDGEVVADSSVIVQYLEEKHPEPPVLPATPRERARARWIEEFADTRMADVFLWRAFSTAVLLPGVFGRERDLDRLQRVLAEEVPPVMDCLEALAPESGFLFDDFGLADISAAMMFRNMRYARWTPDASRWPKSARWIAAAEAHPALATCGDWADALIRVPVLEQRAALKALGVRVTAETLAVDQPPRRGPMTQFA